MPWTTPTPGPSPGRRWGEPAQGYRICPSTAEFASNEAVAAAQTRPQGPKTEPPTASEDWKIPYAIALTSPQGAADNSEAPPRDGAARSSVEAAVTVAERRGGVIWQAWRSNRVTGRIPS